MSYDCYLLSLTKHLMVLLGVWPLTTANLFLKYFYKYYGILIELYFVYFVSTILLETVLLLKYLTVGQRADIFTFLLVYSLSIWKAHLITTKPIHKLMYEIKLTEKSIKENRDYVLESIYKKYSVYNFKIGSILPVVTMLCFLILFTNAVLSFKILENSKTFIIPEWFPFKDKYFSIYYWYQISCSFLGGVYVLSGDSLIVSLILFATLQIKLLGAELSRLFQDKTADHSTNVKQLRLLILKHKDVIRYVAELKENFKVYFFIDFLLKSYQISLTFFNILEVTDIPKIQAAFNFSEALVLFTQLTIMYYQANQISVESEKLGTCIYGTKWYDQPIEIKRTLLIMMMRSQRPLKLECFGVVTLSNQFLQKVVKAGYTYIILKLSKTKVSF